MKKASFIIGLIGGILGILSCSFLLFTGLNMKVTEADVSKVIIFSILGILMSILALVGACISNKKILTGTFIILGAIVNIPCSLYSISADNPVTFIFCGVTMILLFISGIIRLCEKK